MEELKNIEIKELVEEKDLDYVNMKKAKITS